MPSSRSRVVATAAVILVGESVAAVLVLLPDHHAGLLGAGALMVAPGVMLMALMSRRGITGVVGGTLGVGLSVAVLAVLAVLLAVAPVGLGHTSVAAGTLMLLAVGGSVWALRARPMPARASRIRRPGWLDVTVMMLAAGISLGAVGLAVVSASPADAGPLLALYTQQDATGGGPLGIAIRTEGMGAVRCALTMTRQVSADPRGGMVVRRSAVVIDQGSTWTSPIGDAAERTGTTLQVMLDCETDDGQSLQRRLRLVPTHG